VRIAAVDDRFLKARITPIDAGDIGPAMPMTERETIDGARRRAMSIIGRTPRDTDVTGCIAVGVEGGLDPLAGDDEHYALKSWAAATDGRDVGYGCGGSILMPDHIVRAVLAGCELGDVIDDLAGTSVRGTRGAWGVLTRDLVGRRDSFTTAIIAALAPFYNTALYAR
jgi:non-canonical (house-cleaning) NTP pyrophosphatase